MTLYEGDLDLRPYLAALSKRWKIAVLLAIIGGIIGLGISLSKPKEYRSTATVIVTHNQLRLSLAEQFPTINENRDTKSRMDAYLTIAQSDYIAQATSEQISVMDPSINLNPEEINSLVDVTSRGYAINITANTTDPELSAAIANSWAEETTKVINLAYSGDQPLAEIQDQIQQAEIEYQEAQGNLESLIKESSTTTLENKIAEAKSLLNAQSADQAWLYYYYFNRKQYLEDLMFQLAALKKQVEKQPNSAAGDLGDALAVLTARMNSLGITQDTGSASVNVSPSNPVNETSNLPAIEFNPSSAKSQPNFFYQLPEISTLLESNTNYSSDIEGLLNIAKAEQDRVNQELQKLENQEFVGATDSSSESLGSQIQALQAQLEFERARNMELTSKRDLAQNTLVALREKEKELQAAAQSSNEVAIASPAVPPSVSNPRRIVIDTLMAAAFGFFIGIFWIIISQWWVLVGKGKGDITTAPVIE